MSHTQSIVAGVATLAIGTYLLRVAGPALRSRIAVSPHAAALMDRAAIVLLTAVAVTGALFVGHDLAGWARPTGVAVGVIAAVCKAPLLVVVTLAIVTTAALRFCGIA